MPSISSVNLYQQRFVNQQNDHQAASPAKLEDNLPTTQVQLVRVGDDHAKEQADYLFERANAFAKLSTQGQRMILGYESVAREQQRDAVRQVMGVDLFA